MRRNAAHLPTGALPVTLARPLAALALAALAALTAACSGRGGPDGPGARRGPSLGQAEYAAAFACKVKPYAGPDGTIARQALEDGLKAKFAAADANGDGVLQKSEIAALNAARGASCDSEPVIDFTGEGRMTFADYAARSLTLFDRAGADADGVVTADESARLSRPPRGPARPPETRPQ